MKATSSICGPNDNVVIPRGAQKCDWEVELARVIGQPGKYIDEADALQHVAGHCIVNDVPERGFQLECTATWRTGKTADTFGPAVTCLFNPDAEPDPHKLLPSLTVHAHPPQARPNNPRG